jgi:hypothetical protein
VSAAHDWTIEHRFDDEGHVIFCPPECPVPSTRAHAGVAIVGAEQPELHPDEGADDNALD